MMITARVELEQFFKTKHSAARPLYRYSQHLLKQSDERNVKFQGRFRSDGVPVSHKMVELEILDQFDEPVIKPLYHGHDVISVDGFVYPNRVLFVTGYGKRKPSLRGVIQESVLSEMQRCQSEFKCIPTLLYWFGQPADNGLTYYIEAQLDEMQERQRGFHRKSTSNKVWLTLPDRFIAFRTTQEF